MSVFRTLVQLETSRHRFWSPVKRPRVFWIIAFLLFLGAVLAGIKSRSFEGLTAVAGYLTVYAAFGMSLGIVLPMMGEERMWYLGLPVSRRTLLLSKWVSSCRLALRGSLMIWGVLVAATLFLSVFHPGTLVVSRGNVVDALLWFLVSLCAALSATMFGAFSPVFQIGWWRLCWFFAWVLVSTWALPLIWLSRGNRHAAYGTYSVQAYLEYTLILLLLSAALFLLLYRFSSSVLTMIARQTAANRQYGRPERRSASVRQPLLGSGERRVVRTVMFLGSSPFWALFWLEFSRYRLFGRETSRVLKVLVGLVLLLMAVLAGLSVRLSNSVTGPTATFFDITTIAGLVCYFFLIMRSMNDGYNKWFVAIPISRYRVILARVMAFFFRYVLCLFMLVVAGFIGMLTVQLIHPYMWTFWEAGIRVLWHGALLSLLFSFLLYAVLTVSPTLIAKATYSTLLTVLVYVAGIQLWNYWFISVLLHERQKYWMMVGLVIVLGVPIAYFSLRYAARHMDRLAREVNRRRRGWNSRYRSWR